MSRKAETIGLIAFLIAAFANAGFTCSIVVIPVKVARNIVVNVTRNGAPMAATTVVVSDWRTDTPKLIARVTTDADGNATFRGLPLGMYRVTSSTWPPFDWQTEIQVEDRSGITPVAVETQPVPEPPAPVRLESISGTVLDPSGAVIPGAIVIAEAPDHSRTTLAAARTDGAGRVNLTVRSSFVTLRISVQGFQTAVVPAQLTAADDAWPGFRLTMNLAPCGEEKPYLYRIEPESLHQK